MGLGINTTSFIGANPRPMGSGFPDALPHKARGPAHFPWPARLVATSSVLIIPTPLKLFTLHKIFISNNCRMTYLEDAPALRHDTPTQFPGIAAAAWIAHALNPFQTSVLMPRLFSGIPVRMQTTKNMVRLFSSTCCCPNRTLSWRTPMQWCHLSSRGGICTS